MSGSHASSTYFIGELRSHAKAGGFSLGHWTANVEPDRPAHFHEQALFIYIISGRYLTQAKDLGGEAGGRLIYNPPQLEHEDGLADGRGSFLSIAIGGELSARLGEGCLPDEPVSMPMLRSQMVALRLLRELAGDGGDAIALESRCLELEAVSSGPHNPGDAGA